MIAAQSSADWATRGVVTGTNMFARSVGSAVGVAVFGAIANAAVAGRVGGSHPDLEHLPAGVLDPAIHEVYVASAVAAVLLVVSVLVIPRSARASSPDAIPAGQV